MANIRTVPVNVKLPVDSIMRQAYEQLPRISMPFDSGRREIIGFDYNVVFRAIQEAYQAGKNSVASAAGGHRLPQG